MSLNNWIIYLVVGRILIYLWMQFPLPKFIEKIKTIKYLHECDLCSGVWLYTFLALFMGMDLLKVLLFTHVPLVSEFITGCVVSWVVHIFVIGWKAKYEIVVV